MKEEGSVYRFTSLKNEAAAGSGPSASAEGYVKTLIRFFPAFSTNKQSERLLAHELYSQLLHTVLFYHLGEEYDLHLHVKLPTTAAGYLKNYKSLDAGALSSSSSSSSSSAYS